MAVRAVASVAAEDLNIVGFISSDISFIFWWSLDCFQLSVVALLVSSRRVLLLRFEYAGHDFGTIERVDEIPQSIRGQDDRSIGTLQGSITNGRSSCDVGQMGDIEGRAQLGNFEVWVTQCTGDG